MPLGLGRPKVSTSNDEDSPSHVNVLEFRIAFRFHPHFHGHVERFEILHHFADHLESALMR